MLAHLQWRPFTCLQISINGHIKDEPTAPLTATTPAEPTTTPTATSLSAMTTVTATIPLQLQVPAPVPAQSCLTAPPPHTDYHHESIFTMETTLLSKSGCSSPAAHGGSLLSRVPSTMGTTLPIDYSGSATATNAFTSATNTQAAAAHAVSLSPSSQPMDLSTKMAPRLYMAAHNTTQYHMNSPFNGLLASVPAASNGGADVPALHKDLYGGRLTPLEVVDSDDYDV